MFARPCYSGYHWPIRPERSQMNLPFKMPDKDSNFGKLTDHTGTAVVKYWPIIIAVVAASLSVGAIYTKLDYIAKVLDRNESQFNAFNDRQTLFSQSTIEMRSQLSNQNETNARFVQQLNDINRRVDAIADKQRWAPK